MDPDRVIITGVPGGARPRREIYDFIKDEKQFSLYIQALRRMYEESQSTSRPQSWFQVGSIHGLPYTPWNGVLGVDNNEWDGYCTHGTVVSLVWHRPYVMLLEQILNKHAREIAADYTVDRVGWQMAAANLRQPYWDWALNMYPPEEVMSLDQVTIIGKDGKKVKVTNPLVRYRFHPRPDDTFVDSDKGQFKTWPTTLRHPTSTTDPKATDNIEKMRSTLACGYWNDLKDTYNMLIHLNTWEAFSNHTATATDPKTSSLETIHDNVHGYMGGSGHVAKLEYAGFDPLFYLHHCNIDRLLSLWCAIHPDAWVTSGKSLDGTFTLPPDIDVDVNTPLKPFWNQPTTSELFWASSGLKNLGSLGYTYPEFSGLDMKDKESVKTEILRIVNKLYGRHWIFPTSKEKTGQPIVSTVQAAFSQTADQSNSSVFDWVARVRFKKYELGTSFYIVFFLGEVPRNSKEWLTSENSVGSHYAFVNSSTENCANCRSRLNMVQEGFIQLNYGIAKHSKLDSLQPNVVAPYLKDKIQWRVVEADGTVLELSSLEVVIFDVPLTLPPGAEVPVAHRSNRPEGITLRRPAIGRT